MTPPTIADKELADLLARAKARYEAMTLAEREEMHRAQRESYVRAELAMGDDEDEAEYRRCLGLGGD